MTSFRIHPTIGFARVGSSDEYYLAPETPASLPIGQDVDGGLPIRAGTEADHITSTDLRDSEGALKRQAARFHIYAYDEGGAETYPHGGGTPITIGATIDGKTVVDILWQVHVANKKANAFVLEYPPGTLRPAIANYESGLPPVRNAGAGDPNDPDRIRKLTIDPGPRTIAGSSGDTVAIDDATTPSYLARDRGAARAVELAHYPTSFPGDGFPTLYCPAGSIDTLGDVATDESGRLLVVGAYGRACAWFQDDGSPYPLADFVDNDGWFDDTADGPVDAVVVFDDGSTSDVAGAWVVSTDPAYAPQTVNIVSLWDDIFDSWVRKLDLIPELFDVGFDRSFAPSFVDHVAPIFRAVAVQEYNTNLPSIALEAHKAVGAIEVGRDPADTIMSGLNYVRNPNNPNETSIGAPLMPLSLGDQGRAFLAPTATQYFFLEQWNAGTIEAAPVGRGPGEELDFASLFNCLGGRFSPGIDMTFIVREPDLWKRDWRSGGGPFRIRSRRLDYAAAHRDAPLLGEGYVPAHDNSDGVEPGDTSKFMALPWHTDYNSCATHTSGPNPDNSTTLFWSWPAQRPVSVYVAADVDSNGDGLPDQRYSVRGPGTASPNAKLAGRYADALDMVTNWPMIGTVIQGTAIDEADGGPFPKEWLLEVASQLEQPADEPGPDPWPINVFPGTQ